MIGNYNLDDNSKLIELYSLTKVYSFDFDGTLNNSFYTNGGFNEDLTPKEGMVKLIKKLKKSDNIVYVVTSRYSDTIKTVFDFLNKHEIHVDGVVATNGNLKARTLLKLGVNLHFDNTLEEIENNIGYGVNSYHVK